MAGQIAGVVGVVAIAFGSWSCQSDYSGPVEPITIGIPSAVAVHAYIDVAQEQGYFARNRLKVTIREYQEGLNALNDLISGEVDIASTSEYPIVGKAFNKDGDFPDYIDETALKRVKPKAVNIIR